MTNKHFPAPEVAEIGQRLIQEHHPDLRQTDWKGNMARFEFYFSTETRVDKGAEIWGTARKVSGLNAFLKRGDELQWAPSLTDEQIAQIEDEDERDCARMDAEMARREKLERGNLPFFAIMISHPIWNKLDESQRVALVDHELMHCVVDLDDGGLKLSTRGHDFEGFNEEMERHGLWRPNAYRMSRAMNEGAQMKLDLDDDEATVTIQKLDLDDDEATVTIQSNINGQMSEPVTLKSRDLTRLDAMLSEKEGA